MLTKTKMLADDLFTEFVKPRGLEDRLARVELVPIIEERVAEYGEEAVRRWLMLEARAVEAKATKNPAGLMRRVVKEDRPTPCAPKGMRSTEVDGPELERRRRELEEELPGDPDCSKCHGAGWFALDEGEPEPCGCEHWMTSPAGGQIYHCACAVERKTA